MSIKKPPLVAREEGDPDVVGIVQGNSYGDDGKWTGVMCNVGGIRIQVLLDSGAEFSIVSREFYESHLAELSLKKEMVRNTAVAANGEEMKIMFALWIPVIIDEIVFQINFRVMPEISVNAVFGNNVLSKVDVLASQNILLFPEMGVKLDTHRFDRNLE